MFAKKKTRSSASSVFIPCFFPAKSDGTLLVECATFVFEAGTTAYMSASPQPEVPLKVGHPIIVSLPEENGSLHPGEVIKNIENPPSLEINYWSDISPKVQSTLLPKDSPNIHWRPSTPQNTPRNEWKKGTSLKIWCKTTEKWRKGICQLVTPDPSFPNIRENDTLKIAAHTSNDENTFEAQFLRRSSSLLRHDLDLPSPLPLPNAQNDDEKETKEKEYEFIAANNFGYRLWFIGILSEYTNDDTLPELHKAIWHILRLGWRE